MLFKMFRKEIENQNEEKIVVVVHSDLSLENPIRPMPEAKKRKGNSFRNGNMSPSTLQVQKNKTQEIQERESIVLWKRPVVTLSYFIGETVITLKEYGQRLREKKSFVIAVLIILATLAGLCQIKGPHQLYVQIIQKQLWWCSYWVGLGILSSVGFGSGLHTFLLYLGPHIASVTLAAYECGTLDFPQPPYPDEIVCPEDDSVLVKMPITLWKIMSKVRLEAFMWGAGTALGELPPYFMARAARLSGIDTEEVNQELLHPEHSNPQSVMDKIKVWIQKLVEKVGFFGILACASIPNPLFDLAGITCGHFLVPFWTFFGATLVGKAIIKMHIQKLFVIIAFDESLVEKAVNVTEHVPYVGKYINAPFRDFLEKQKANFHRKTAGSPPAVSWLSRIMEVVLIVTIGYFLLSIVNSLAQKYHKRVVQKQRENAHKRAKD